MITDTQADLRADIARNGLRQKDIAELIGLSPPRLSQLLNTPGELTPKAERRIRMAVDALKGDKARDLLSAPARTGAP